MKTKVFVDSSFWIALIDKSDTFHPKVNDLKKIDKWSNFEFFTSDCVLNECLTRLKKKVGPKTSFYFYKFISRHKNEKSLTVFQTDDFSFDKAYKIFKKNPIPKTFTFTDASIVALMKIHKINYLLTFDEDFKKIKPEIKILP